MRMWMLSRPLPYSVVLGKVLKCLCQSGSQSVPLSFWIWIFEKYFPASSGVHQSRTYLSFFTKVLCSVFVVSRHSANRDSHWIVLRRQCHHKKVQFRHGVTKPFCTLLLQLSIQCCIHESIIILHLNFNGCHAGGLSYLFIVNSFLTYKKDPPKVIRLHWTYVT